ncbi:glycerophosphoryl diester phosphodiesterase membrane domain-containing protein [Altererythrobacter sp. Root672]|uniref:glycerophosphoryl diester phosphodiesterase membrane domain-containing protein n=1 Tax=Altererythrobacter sp. Root672 TaxID=1736584 RepID=UPI0006F29A8E|nr:glycerophosphoryl diester phosphodiesterase membrane domain-containing protein [Altererythrobacter sp. Root672]KRA82586.1 hypothetical protein ASD76_00300 [Altererythrobacter sp. Root672]
MEFDMGRAWNDAMALLRANRDVVLIVAAVFFFLPYLTLVLLMPDYAAAMGAGGMAQPADPSQAFDAALEQMAATFDQVKWLILGSAILQGIGMLGLLTLLTDKRRPTVGEALVIGAKCLIPYILAQLLMGFALMLLMFIPIMVGASTNVAIGVLLGLVAFVALCYLMTKFSLVAPVIAIERVFNPIAALQRSWRLTKGNSVRLFFFYVLLFVVAAVISIVVGLFVALFAAVGGETAGQIANGVIDGFFNMVVAVLFLAVLAATHKQLAGPSTEAVSETFE